MINFIRFLAVFQSSLVITSCTVEIYRLIQYLPPPYSWIPPGSPVMIRESNPLLPVSVRKFSAYGLSQFIPALAFLLSTMMLSLSDVVLSTYDHLTPYGSPPLTPTTKPLLVPRTRPLSSWGVSALYGTAARPRSTIHSESISLAPNTPN